MNRKIQVLAILFSFLVACTPQPLSNPNQVTQEPADSSQNETKTQVTQEEVDIDPDKKGPWDGSLYMTTSSDGLSFSGKTLVLERAGVPNLLKLQSGELILTYQYFSNTDAALFDIIAYSVSKDSGHTWSDPAAIQFEDLPSARESRLKPMDPSLVQLEDGRLRLYFTYHANGNEKPALYSATTQDSDISSAFTVNKTVALMVSANLLDPAVTFFNGKWHHYTWQDASDNNYHSVSDDGETFTMQDEISLEMDFLGQVISYQDRLRFYGTGKGGVVSATSSDGYSWTKEAGTRVQGADPGVQQLDDGTFVMVYTSMNFN